MASEVDICNVSLSRLGDQANITAISPPDGSAQAGHCAIFYPMARDLVLGEYNWNFTTVRASLTPLVATPAFGWLYAYAAPSNMLAATTLHLQGASDDNNTLEFEHETLLDGTEVIYANATLVALKYQKFVTDTTKFDPSVVESITWLLASYLAGPIIKGVEGRDHAKFCLQMYGVALRKAIAGDAAQRKVRPTHYPEHLKARTGMQATRLSNPPTA